MELHQLQIGYNQEQDRLLLRATFRNPDRSLHEIRAWITRRILSRLWPGILRALEAKVTLEQPQAQHAKREIVGMTHQSAVSDNVRAGNFAAKFEESPTTSYPLGKDPLLISTVNFNLSAKAPVRIEFAQTDGKRFEVGFADPVLHSFCKLIQDGVIQADWGLELTMPGINDGAAATPHMLN